MEETQALPLKEVTTVEVSGRTYHLVGTAHVSKESIEAVKAAITALKPDCVCVELDEKRLDTLKNATNWEKLNLGQALREGKGPYLMANLAMSAFQKKMGLHTGVKPGEELYTAVKTAEEAGIRVELCDRNIRTTLIRAWRKTGFWKKMWVVSSLVASAFEEGDLTEEDLTRLKNNDTLSALLEDVGKALPTVKEILIDERDLYMAGMLQRAQGQNIVAVVGAGHVPGLTRLLAEPIDDATLKRIDELPPKSLFSRLVPWLVPGTIIAAFIAGLFFMDPMAMGKAALVWAATNGAFAAVGSALCLAHPFAIITAFLTAPFGTLSPLLHVGMTAGVVQAWAGKPRVCDVECLLEDLSHWKGWWRNRVGRVFLVFFITPIFGGLGNLASITLVKGYF